MASVKIFWDPQGFELDSLRDKPYLGESDGDTTIVSVSIRMLSIDTPEVHYPGNTRPSKHDSLLQQLADWINQGQAPVTDDLAAHLHPRLATGQAGTVHEQQGNAATAELQQIVKARLTKPNGKKRRVFLRAADEHFDQYGRLLAYVAPHYSTTELATISPEDRATFNLSLVKSGWAASFPIYPSIPKHADLILLHEAAQDAIENGRGAWAEPLLLTGYEFRMCYRLAEVTKKLVAGKKVSSAERKGWIERYCVDMTTREIFYPEDYIRVPPANRIFIYPKHVSEAVSRMNLLPAGT